MDRKTVIGKEELLRNEGNLYKDERRIPLCIVIRIPAMKLSCALAVTALCALAGVSEGTTSGFCIGNLQWVTMSWLCVIVLCL